MKHVKLFEGFTMDKAPDAPYSGYLKLDVDMGYPDKTEDWLKELSRICGEHGLDIVGLVPFGTGGGAPVVTFRGTGGTLRAMLKEEGFEDIDWMLSSAKPTAYEKPAPNWSPKGEDY
jgi:hypothetical protein